MNPSQCQFTIRRLIALVGLVAVLLWVILRWDNDTHVVHDFGTAHVRLTFHVIEADTKLPIGGAVIHLGEYDYRDNPVPPYYVDLVTGQDNHAMTMLALRCYATQGLRP